MRRIRSKTRRGIVHLTLGLLIAAGFSHAAAQPCEVTGSDELNPAQPIRYDDFGSAVSISENVALVGAPWDGQVAEHSGVVYVFRFSGDSWVEEASLRPADTTAHMSFGTAVSVCGDVALIGTGSGGAYVFRCDGTAWHEEAKLDVASVGFGHAVAIDGDVAVVGAYGDDSAGDEAGAVYVFTFDGSEWTQEARLTPTDSAAGDWFGFSVGISGSAIVAGARYDGGTGNNGGAAYVFRRTDDQWHQETKLAAAGGGTGFTVSIDGDVCVVGAPWLNRAYVYRYDGSAWLLDSELTNADRTADDHFGWSVSVSDDVVVVGVIAWDQEGAYYQRPTSVFYHAGSTWSEQAQLAPSESAFAEFGCSVSVSGNKAVIGEVSDSYYGTHWSTTYAFRGLSDCNGNGYLDVCDMASGLSVDADADGLPDECDTAPDDDTQSGDDTDQTLPDGFEILDSCCGSGACGAGTLGWLPASLLGLGYIKKRMH